MATTHPGIVLRHLRGFVTAEGTRTAPDRHLLHRFAHGREEAAFETLVRRHGPLVLGVCRRVLHQEQDAEDVFQATFLVLARKAGSLNREGPLGGWLSRVAYHMALKTRKRTAARQRRESHAGRRTEPDPLAEVTGRELLAVFDEELQALPECERVALVLCYLEGKTRDEAAREAGCSASTLKRRLERGKERMRLRLARRGLALPGTLLAAGLAQGARAAVRGPLTARAVKAGLLLAAGRPAAGVVSARALALASEALGALAANKVNVLGLILVALALVGAGAGLFAFRGPAAPGAAEEPKRPVAAPPAGAEDRKATAVDGRVLDADGKPVAGAWVTGFALLDMGRLSVERREKALADVKTDAEGRFRLPLPDGERLIRVELLAGAKGYGPAWSRVDPAGRTDVELRLAPEEALVGRLLDLQGLPVGKAKLRPVRILGEARKPGRGVVPPDDGTNEAARLRKRLIDLQRRQQGFEFRKDSPRLPEPVTTDAEGRFRVGGFGRGQDVELLVEDDRAAAQEIAVTAGAEERSFTLVPPHKVTGRVVTADTDKPITGAWVGVSSFQTRRNGQFVAGQTDAEGRFAINAYPGDSYTVEVAPPRGEPYLGALKSAEWPKGTIKQEVDFKLARGVVVRGRVVEAGSGRAVVSAWVNHIPQRERPAEPTFRVVNGPDRKAFTGADGTFQMVVPPGPGRLAVTGPNPDYAYQTVSDQELQTGKPGGLPNHYHAVLPLDLAAKDDTKEVKVELCRAVTIKGRVVGPDGKPVNDAVVFVPGELAPSPARGLIAPGLPLDARAAAVAARDGAFELTNCDPDKTYRVFVLSGRAEARSLYAGAPAAIDAGSVANRLLAGKDHLGAVADLSAKGAGGKPVEVRLAPCSSAEVRFADAGGKAVRQKVWLELLVKPGPSVPKSRAEGKPAAEAALLAVPHPVAGQKSPIEADADGRITIPALIPGATYRLKVLAGPPTFENEIVFEKDFTAEPGRTTKLELVAPEGK
jgi:RNA polymerase sigma factor (sigma-70 family)